MKVVKYVSVAKLPENESTRSVLPPKSVSIDARLVQDTAKVTVRQHFWNNAETYITRGSYVFPLPNGCTITSFSCRIGQDEILNAKSCRRAVAEQHVTTLLEQNTPEIFTASLGNIPKDTLLKTELTNIITFTIPTYIANRYGNAPVDMKGMVHQEIEQNLTLQISIVAPEAISNISSDTHKILVERNDLTEAESKTGAAWLEDHPTLENQKAIMVAIPPTSMMTNNQIEQHGEILFLADRSGSMDDKMETLRSSLKYFLNGIPLDRTFNIWSFGSHYEYLWPRSRPYNPEFKEQAVNYVQSKFQSDMGGTEILDALKALVQARDLSSYCDIIILTDGEVWRLDETLDFVQRTRSSSEGKVRFFAHGIGAHVSHALVEGIATLGGGYSEVVPKASQGRWEDRVVAMTKAALTNHTATPKLDLGNLGTPRAPENLELKLQNSDPIIHNLAARAVLDDIERHQRYFDPSKSFDSAQAEEISCRYSLLSKWTSFFLEQENLGRDGDEPLMDRIIPVDCPSQVTTLLQPRGLQKSSSGSRFLDISRKRSRPLSSYLKERSRARYPENIQKSYIAKLLDHQAYDGSIRSSARRVLGKDITATIIQVKNHISKHILADVSSPTHDTKPLAYTVVVVDLWDLMHTKALQFISSHVSDELNKDELFYFTKEKLRGSADTSNDPGKPGQ
ncbi:von Willebrand factor type A domain-containing protein [Biscogniauxia marginata]|nr:von Willebrand factor type A domain-containing protein [Biscogniauxia marginata]